MMRDGYEAEFHADRFEQCRNLPVETVYASRFCTAVLYESISR